MSDFPPALLDIIANKGPLITVSVPGTGSWKVPREYIAKHGLKVEELATLAEENNWEKYMSKPCIGRDGIMGCRHPAKFVVAGDYACVYHLITIVTLRLNECDDAIEVDYA